MFRFSPEVASCGPDAPHKRRRMTHEEFLARQLHQGKSVSPLFSVQGVTTDIFRRDWLHCADQGVSADFIGNVFHHFCSILPGANKRDRRAFLLQQIQDWYQEAGVTDRLVGLRSWGIRAPKKSPKLKSSAAACRALVPFTHVKCVEYLDAADPVEGAIILASAALKECYDCLSDDAENWSDRLLRASEDFALQCDALRVAAGESNTWVIKPKMHHFIELCSSASKPSLSWTYRDEDYGGSIAQLCRIKGGAWSKVSSYCSRVLLLFKTQNPVPRIV